MADKQPAAAEQPKDKGLWRDLLAYWILGLCNNFGYVVMLSAAYDILAEQSCKEGDCQNKTIDYETTLAEGRRICNDFSVGAILLADVLPMLIVQLLIPYAPFWVNIRIAIAILFAILGFAVVAFANSTWMALCGVILTSISCGAGETTFLAYTYSFNKNCISTWSSGTGGAGIVGSLAYACLRGVGLNTMQTMLVMLLVPFAEILVFWILLRKPTKTEAEKVDDEEQEKVTIIERIKYIKGIVHYMVPLFLVYFFEYFINQGMFELVHFLYTFIDKPTQYRVYSVLYQVGVFISRSSVNIVQFKRIWIMALLQGINVIYFLIEVLCYATPTIWIVFAIILFEGLLGGAAYVNTFYRMAKELPRAEQKLGISLVIASNAVGISSAGFLAIPVHNIICHLKRPERLSGD